LFIAAIRSGTTLIYTLAIVFNECPRMALTMDR
jgi:hypothetical protein